MVSRASSRVFARGRISKTFGTMRRLYTITALVCSLLVVGCSSLFTTTTIAPDDLYRTDNREVVVSRIEAQAEKDAIARASDVGYGSPQSYSSIVADSYESAYARRLYGFNSPTYKLPSSYYNLVGNSTMYYATAYDPAYYNIMVSGDQVWVEPKYITSMFGSWGATNVTFGLYSSPWNYGWSYGVSPFYYSWWGYPRYSWYDWNWNICYNPWYYDWYWGYPSYGHHHHHHYPGFMPPQHRPGNRPGYHSGSRPNHGFVVTGSGASAGPGVGNLNGGRGTASSRYTSPTSNKNYGSTTVGTGSNRRGTVSTGINTNSSYQSSGLTVGGGTVRPSTNSGSNRGTATGGSSSNFRQSGSSSRGTSSSSSYRGSSSSSSSSSYRGSTTSSSRSSYSSGSSRSGSGGSSHSGGTTSSRR